MKARKEKVRTTTELDPKARKEKVRTTTELDLMELLALGQQNDARVADALVTVLRADGPTLAALGVVIEFVATQAPRRPR